MPEKRLISFRSLKKNCVHMNPNYYSMEPDFYKKGIKYCDQSEPYPDEKKERCNAANCPIWRRLEWQYEKEQNGNSN